MRMLSVADCSRTVSLEPLIAQWLESWIAGQSSDAIIAGATANHNAYVMLRERYSNIDERRAPEHERQMVVCASRAISATSWLLQLPRRPVREFALLHYAPLCGRRELVTVADLNLSGLRSMNSVDV